MAEHARSEFVRRSERRIWRITLVAVVAIIGMTLAVLALIQNYGERSDRRAQVNEEIHQLACIIVSQTPDDPKRPIIHEFRVKYGCPPYSKLGAQNALNPSDSPTHSPSPRKPSPHPTPTPTVTVTVTVTRTVPGPTVTQTVTRTVTLTTAPGRRRPAIRQTVIRHGHRHHHR